MNTFARSLRPIDRIGLWVLAMIVVAVPLLRGASAPLTAEPILVEPTRADTSPPPERSRSPQRSSSPPTSAGVTVELARTTADPTISLATVPIGASPDEMRFRLDGMSWGAWQPFAARAALRLPDASAYGLHSISTEVRWAGGQISAATMRNVDYVPADQATMELSTSYRLDARLQYADGVITTTETIDLVSRSREPIDSIELSVLSNAFGEFTLRSLEVDGRPVTPMWSSPANLHVRLGRNLAPGDGARVTVRFDGHASDDVSSNLQARFSRAGGVMSLAHWFPIVSDGHGLRFPGDSQFTATADLFRLELHHASDIVVAAPGARVASAVGWDVYELRNARDFAFSVSPDYRVERGSVDGIGIDVYGLPGTDRRTALRAASAAFHAYDEALMRYPWGRFVIAQTPRRLAGMEYPALIFIGSERYGAITTIAHEVGHQWFYGLVGDDQLGTPWIDEGFTEFLADHFFASIPATYCSTRKVNSSVYDFPDRPEPFDPSPCDGYAQTVYFKAASMLDGLRHLMGETAFWAAIRTIVREDSFGIATTTDVVATLERYAPDRPAIDRYLSRYLDLAAAGAAAQR